MSLSDRKPVLYIFRGLPGAGKSTAAAHPGCLVISPQDMYATRGGVYRYCHGQDVAALGWATRLVEVAMKARVDLAIAEVLPRREDVEYWVNLARRYVYDVRVHDLYITPALSYSRNTHNVPRPVIESMARAWEPWEIEAEAVG